MVACDGARTRPLRVLCLHGYAGNGKTFVEVKMKALTKTRDDDDSQLLELCGLDGPVALEGGRGKQRAWCVFDPPFRSVTARCNPHSGHRLRSAM